MDKNANKQLTVVSTVFLLTFRLVRILSHFWVPFTIIIYPRLVRILNLWDALLHIYYLD